jgi:hypothetical protein
MKKEHRVFMRLASISNDVLSGKPVSFFLFLVIGCIIFFFLFLTVHRRDMKEVRESSPARYKQLIMFWIERGYFKHGGLWIRNPDNPEKYDAPKEDENIKWAYRTSPMGHLQLAHFLQRINYLFRGNYSYRLMSLHNQGLVMLASALLGLLAMRLALKMEINAYHALFLGIAVQSTYQTFPTNLMYFWEVYYTTVEPIFVVLFLLLSEKTLLEQKVPTKIHLFRAICVFAIFYIDPPTAMFFLPTYILASAILGFSVFQNQNILRTMVLPAGFALGLWMTQLLWVKVYFPDIKFIGSGFMQRTGFDGSVAYYKDHFNLLYTTELYNYRDLFGNINQWKFLFIAGVISMLFLIIIYHKIPRLKFPILILASTVVLYVPFAFMFSQGTVIHPYAYDSYIVIPILLSLFSVFPATIEKVTENKGIFVFASIIVAFCYCMVQIRTYAIQFPLGAGG